MSKRGQMEQLTQELKAGKMGVLEVPFPILGRGQVLVRNHFSVISAGTEGKTVADARKGYIAKARSRQKEVLQVVAMIKTTGIVNAYKTVMNKLEAPAPLGYSCAGEVIGVGDGISDLRVGDLVACGGQGAYHAEVVSVFRNLCAKIPKGVDLRSAAFSTIGSIALQGVRQADLRLGEMCVVIGLGLIGQLTVQILGAAGIKTIGIDIDKRQVQAARDGGASLALSRNQPGLEQRIMGFTGGLGADAVIIAAGSQSLDPVELAGVLCRQKGKVVIVGAVPTGFSRIQYYRKELDLRLSCSYGPGRYDPIYEEKGIDYPVGYVRWTENRNREAVLDLMAARKLDISRLITHSFMLKDAPQAYRMILLKKEHFLGIVIEYDRTKAPSRTIVRKKELTPAGVPAIGFIGVGNFAQSTLLPRLKGKTQMIGVADPLGQVSRHVADKYDFSYCTDDPKALIEDDRINTVFIATRHHLHARYAISALRAGKNVFIEKPLAMSESELEEVRKAYEGARSGTRLMVGFNRRFAPLINTVREFFPPDGPKSIQLRVNAGILPKEHWVNDPEIGGGRIIGEACHFIDLAMFLAAGRIEEVSAYALKDANGLSNTIVAGLRFDNGSIAALSYISNGNKLMPKEYLEISCQGTSAQIDDYRKLTVFGKKIFKEKSRVQDKGHSGELKAFLDSIRKGEPCPVPFEESYLSMLATFKILESLKTGRSIGVF